MKTVHLIFNAHLDPIWLWPWQAGIDELLGTCRTTCDLLDRHPDLVFTRGEAWVYWQIERLEPILFNRIKKHIASGRWEVVGGWWLQPDCNLPGGAAFEKQINMGREYFNCRFGFFPDIAYNVDSFGHAATLPGYMAAAGQKHYVMMRPNRTEKELPARMFRWRGYVGGPEIITFRIADSYNARDITLEHVEKSLTSLPPGVDHTMCYVGTGDHGGGPTEKQMQWCRDHAHVIPGAQLVMSTPSRFFKAVAATNPKLPLVTGDLQYHAIGCYSVHHPVKSTLRRAEHLLNQAEVMRSQLGEKAALLPDLKRGWEQVCFHHFHDTLGGTCIPSAYVQIMDQLGEAASLADENLQIGLRFLVSDLPGDVLQRLVISNPSVRQFSGYVELEPWLEWQKWDGAQIIDEKGKIVPHQTMQSEAQSNGLTRLLLPVTIPAKGQRIFRLRLDAKTQSPKADAAVVKKQIQNKCGVMASPGAVPKLSFLSGKIAIQPQLELMDDPTDTWSHGIDRYAGKVLSRPKWSPSQILDRGPLMASFAQTGSIGESKLTAEYRVYAEQPWIDLRLRVHWMETQKLLKLVVRHPGLGSTRIDGIMGGKLTRPNIGQELPFQNWTLLSLDKGPKFGVICPDVYGLDATEKRVALTLLRSPYLAHHEPNPGTHPRGTVSDQGVHDFRFKFWVGKSVTPSALEHEAFQMQEPPLFADLTKGMPSRWQDYIESRSGK